MTMPFVQMTKVELLWVETLWPILLARLSNLMIQHLNVAKLYAAIVFFIVDASASSSGCWLGSKPLPLIYQVFYHQLKVEGSSPCLLCWLR
jgi:hypothetical protein